MKNEPLHPSGELSISRSFNAPRERVWKAWTDADTFSKWWGPQSFSTPYSSMDFQEGGKYLHCMQDADGNQFWSTGNYETIIPLEKITCTDSFADEKGNKVSAGYYGMSEGFPDEMRITISFEDQGDQTMMILKHSGIENISDKDRSDMEKGWNESFDKLVELLAEPEEDDPILNY